MWQRKARKEAGFSLLEVLVAFVILATVVATLLNVFAGGLRNLKVSDEYAIAVALAESELEKVGRMELISPGTSTGSWRDFHWHTRVQDSGLTSSGEGQEPIIFLVEVEVQWGEGKAARSFKLGTLRARSRAESDV